MNELPPLFPHSHCLYLGTLSSSESCVDWQPGFRQVVLALLRHSLGECFYQVLLSEDPPGSGTPHPCPRAHERGPGSERVSVTSGRGVSPELQSWWSRAEGRIVKCWGPGPLRKAELLSKPNPELQAYPYPLLS